MSDFIVSARKYRPETFKSVVGQASITSTLKNAIAGNHLGHAYLFCGPRGVGKTTCARIFAKTINCQNLTPETEPCNKCESCKSFNESRSYNIHELDAASNNTVDDIRTLNEQVRIPPQIGKYSVYIIDEVHMLSQSAFNAFLKTLEEPPSHAVFILATTEKHKIIPTILSRCQIFDFNRIKVPDAVSYMEFIAKSEGIDYEKEAFHVIAQKADGAMRDALSIFDQVVSFSGKKIEYQSVIENLNILDFEYYFKLCNNFLKADVSSSLLVFDEILDKGFDSHNFINGLASHLRELLVSLDPQTIQLLEVSDNLKQRYLDQAKDFSPNLIFSLLEICTQLDLQFKASRNQRLLIELGLVKMSNILAEKKKPEPIVEEIAAEEENISDQTASSENKENQDLNQALENDNHIENKETSPPVAEKIKKNLVRSSGFSIKNALNQSGGSDISENGVEESIDEVEEEIEIQEFTKDDLQHAWNSFANTIKTEKPRIYSSLKSRKPELQDNYKVIVTFDNDTQLQDFNLTIKQLLLVHLKKELRNSEVFVEILMSEEKDKGKKLYTSEEKFNFLSKKNPDLAKLKQQFNLDFD